MTKEEMEKLAATLPSEAIFLMVRDEKSHGTLFLWSTEWLLKCAGDAAMSGVCLNILADAGESFLETTKQIAEELKGHGVN